MKMKKPEKLILYQKYLAEHKAEREIEEIKQNIAPGADKEQIVIKKLSAVGKGLEIISDLFFRLFRLLLIMTILGLLSFAVTILVNTELRNTVFGILKGMM